MTHAFDFWDALAPHHSRIENSYFDLPSLRRILPEIKGPVLVVGAGQGLLVGELRKKGLVCDGVDFSSEMIRQARTRRGLALIQADATAMPFPDGSYQTIIYATGVVDFTSDEGAIRVMMREARRILFPSGTIFVGFYRVSAASKDFLVRLNLLRENVLAYRETLALYKLGPLQALAWTARRAKIGYLRATLLALRSWGLSIWQEKRNAFQMQKIFANLKNADALLEGAPEKQPCRDEAGISHLFGRLGIPIKQLKAFRSCFIVRI